MHGNNSNQEKIKKYLRSLNRKPKKIISDIAVIFPDFTAQACVILADGVSILTEISQKIASKEVINIDRPLSKNIKRWGTSRFYPDELPKDIIILTTYFYNQKWKNFR